MKVRSLLSILFLSVVYFFGCKEETDNSGFTLSKVTNTSNRLRLDGYYYLKTDSSLIAFVFYGDGVVVDGMLSWESLPAIEKDIQDGTFHDRIADKLNWWGRYVVTDNHVSMEFPHRNDNGVIYTHVRNGLSLNDTTLVFTKIVNNQYKIENAIADTLHFKAFHVKPDSICTF
jgi:hypothetical protein